MPDALTCDAIRTPRGRDKAINRMPGAQHGA
jgi:hypothetical protein